MTNKKNKIIKVNYGEVININPANTVKNGGETETAQHDF